MHTAFFGLPNNSQVIRVRGAAAPRVFLTRITCFPDKLQCVYIEVGCLLKDKDVNDSTKEETIELTKD